MADRFTSIRHPVAVDDGRGSFAEETDYAAHVEQMILQVLFTNPGERINRPDFGCGLRRMIFAPNNPAAAALAQVTIFQSLTLWLGTAITVNEVRVNSVDSRLEVNLTYTLLVRQERRYLNLQVTA